MPLKPVVAAAVDLHQLSQTSAPQAGAVDPLSAAFLGYPNLGLNHPSAQGLSAVGKAVVLGQVFPGKFGSEVARALAHQFVNGLTHTIVDLEVAALASALGDQPCIAVLTN